MRYYVYCLTDGEVWRYFGITRRPRLRERQHGRRHAGLSFRVLCICPREYAETVERSLIGAAWRSGRSILNKAPGGLIGPHTTVSPVTRGRISRAMSGKRKSRDHRARLREATRRQWQRDPETGHTGCRHAPHVREALSRAAKRGNRSPQRKARQSEIARRNWSDPKIRARMEHGLRKASRASRLVRRAFTPSEARSIRQRHAAGEGVVALASEYSVDRHTISNLVHERTYRDV